MQTTSRSVSGQEKSDKSSKTKSSKHMESKFEVKNTNFKVAKFDEVARFNL